MDAWKLGLFFTVIGVISALMLDAWAPDFRVQMKSADKTENSGDITLQRVVSLAPNITETIFAIGAEERLKGVSSFCRYPSEAQGKTTVGSIANPNLEIILGLRPDGIIMQQPNPRLKDFCRSHGIAYFALEMNDIETIKEGIVRVGELLESKESALELLASMETSFENLRSDKKEGRPRVLLLTGRTPGSLKGMYAAGSKSYMSELLHVAGGENIMADTPKKFVPVSLETVIERDPDIIIETYMQASLAKSTRSQLHSDWQRVPRLTAVKNNEIHIITENFVQIPGPRIVQTAELFKRLCESSKF